MSRNLTSTYYRSIKVYIVLQNSCTQCKSDHQYLMKMLRIMPIVKRGSLYLTLDPPAVPLAGADPDHRPGRGANP